MCSSLDFYDAVHDACYSQKTGKGVSLIPYYPLPARAGVRSVS
jgi:hypothetical protein